jgi:hypothetical protein
MSKAVKELADKICPKTKGEALLSIVAGLRLANGEKPTPENTNVFHGLAEDTPTDIDNMLLACGMIETDCYDDGECETDAFAVRDYIVKLQRYEAMIKVALEDERKGIDWVAEDISEPKTLEEALKQIAKYKAEQDRLIGRVAVLRKPLEFDYEHGRPLLIVKLGEASKGWVPSAAHFDAVRKVLKAAGEDKKSNILLYHYGIMIEKHENGTVVK